MLFVTVGAHTPFDRLVSTVDQWAAANGRTDVFAQIGSSSWAPDYISWKRFLDPEQFRKTCRECQLIIGHAGTGTIITALQLRKPLLVMPRQASCRETRNEHQLATVDRFADFPSVHVAHDEHDLKQWLGRLDELVELSGEDDIPAFASEDLLTTIRDFINDKDFDAAAPVKSPHLRGRSSRRRVTRPRQRVVTNQ